MPPKSPVGAPILFVAKKNGKLRLCVDYRGLNNVTIKNKYPLPLMDPLQEQVKGATVFTKFDLRDGYYLIHIREGDEWKTAFRTQYGQFEYKVMLFGLCNTPATFQGMMNRVLQEFLDKGVVVYLDDVLIYSKTMKEHVQLVRKILHKHQQKIPDLLQLVLLPLPPVQPTKFFAGVRFPLLHALRTPTECIGLCLLNFSPR